MNTILYNNLALNLNNCEKMSAITGIFMRNGKKVDPELMKKMNDKLSHRGPDGSSNWCQGPVGLGHQMLWTTPESLHEVLPLEEDGLVITADARIDNRAELSEKLSIRDEEDVSDSYFILKSYAKWGEDCPDKLLGDFAFAIWDKNEEKLFCARDHMGVKPFYYYLDDDMFVFGTEIKALFEVEGVPKKLDEKRLALSILVDDFYERERSFYKNIKSFIAAHYLEIYSNNINLTRYWQLDSDLEIKMDSDEEYAKKFLEIFTEAVKCRLRSSDNKIGVMLSGGLDSSSVTCIAQKIIEENILKKDIHGFSYIFDDFPESDERYYINKVIETGGIKPHFIKCDNISPLGNIDKIIDYQDQPTSSFQLGMVHKSREMINKKGIHILLTGEGGDQIVSHGEKYLEELLVSFQLKKLKDNLNYNSSLININKNKLFAITIFNVIRSYILKLPFLYFFLEKDKSRLNKDFLKKYDLDKQLNKKYKSYKFIKSREYHYNIIENISHQKSFEIMDQSTSIFSIETRHPFYDKRLIEFCYAVPTELKKKAGFNRYIMRISMDKILPEEIQWRHTKANVAYASIKNLLSEQNILKELVNKENIFNQRYVNTKIIQNILEKETEYKPSISKLFLWRIIIIRLWLEKNKLL